MIITKHTREIYDSLKSLKTTNIVITSTRLILGHSEDKHSSIQSIKVQTVEN
jgi:hypothetical protein